MDDNELIELLWSLLKDSLWNGNVPTEDVLDCIVQEVHKRGIENARFLNEVE